MKPSRCCRCYFVYLQSKPNFLSWRCLNQAIGAGSGLKLFCYRGWGCRADPNLFFALRIFHRFCFRIMASSECGRTVIAGFVGQLLEHCFNPFSGKCFRWIVVQDIGIQSILLLSWTYQSVMLNSPLLPCYKTVIEWANLFSGNYQGLLVSAMFCLTTIHSTVRPSICLSNKEFS